MNIRTSYAIIYVSILGLCTPINAVTNVRDATVCENESLELNCEHGKKIIILYANYGRSSAAVCRRSNNDENKNILCYNENTTKTLKRICEGEQHCNVQSSNKVFGDPCPYTYKYLYVLYRCAAVNDVRDATVCEHKTLKLNCEHEKKITILYANYGRSSAAVCKSGNNDENKNILCYNQNTFETVKDICEGAQQCNVKSSNEVFGDPCVSTHKYLYVLYRCAAVNDFKTALACENKQIELECKKDQLIRILEANYGRKSRSHCAVEPIKSINCGSTSKDVVSDICNNKRKCQLIVSNYKFGDPCFGTTKYLSVKYKCLHVEKEQIKGFKCNDGTTIPHRLMCNGIKDCPDGADETKYTCTGDKPILPYHEI